MQLARDARSSGDPVAAENYYQHAEHYFRLIAAAQEQFRQNQPQPRPDTELTSEEGEDEGESFSNFGQEPGFVPVPQQQQPFAPRDNNQRDHQRAALPAARAAPAARTSIASNASRRNITAAAAEPQPVPDDGGVDRLPSFITGPQPQINGGQGGFDSNGGERERFPRRRRRPQGPRPEGVAAHPPLRGDDFNPGND